MRSSNVGVQFRIEDECPQHFLHPWLLTHVNGARAHCHLGEDRRHLGEDRRHLGEDRRRPLEDRRRPLEDRRRPLEDRRRPCRPCSVSAPHYCGRVRRHGFVIVEKLCHRGEVTSSWRSYVILEKSLCFEVTSHCPSIGGEVCCQGLPD